MRPQTYKILTILLLISLTFIFWYEGQISYDYDFGIHMAVGKYLLSHGIPKTDPFSYTMPSFPYIDHEWASQIIAFKLFEVIGHSGLAIIASLLTIATFVLVLPKKTRPISWVLMSLATGILLTYSGVRPQVITWLFLTFLIRLSLNPDQWLRYQKFIPLLFLIWANLHGGFVAGLMSLVIIILIKLWRREGSRLTNSLLLISSVLLTFINPYGVRIWDEIFLTASDNFLRSTIIEWQPIFVNNSPLFFSALIFYFLFSSFLVLRSIPKLKLTQLALYFFWLILALFSRRHIPLWIIVSLPVTYQAWELGAPKQGKAMLLLVLFSFLVSVYQARLTINGTYPYREDSFYPKLALEFVKSHPIEGNLFSNYDWGGYLLWKLPQRKVFIDGRMPSWRWQAPSDKESSWAFKEYYDLDNELVDYRKVFAKYKIKAVLWPTKLFQRPDLDLTKISTQMVVNPDSFTNKLLKDGWKEVYTDSVSLIFVKPD